MRVKRAVDIVVGSLLTVAALPLIVLMAIGSAISLRAWPLFVQQRVGKDGREFRFPKVRTLPTSAPAASDKYALNGTPIPAFCRFLRRTHLDELPQLLLVPVGLMSLVGPRPEMPTVLRRYPAEFASTRTRVRPGCTGLWQLSTNSTKLIYEAPEYDRAYIAAAGVLLDLWVLYRTLRSWVLGPQAIELEDVPSWAWGGGAVPERAPDLADEFEVEPMPRRLSPIPASPEVYDRGAAPTLAPAEATLVSPLEQSRTAG
jgi:lipopolysaccharide/colanic/teichoic acid biosynthesis glycosyltransferase